MTRHSIIFVSLCFILSTSNANAQTLSRYQVELIAAWCDTDKGEKVQVVRWIKDESDKLAKGLLEQLGRPPTPDEVATHGQELIDIFDDEWEQRTKNNWTQVTNGDIKEKQAYRLYRFLLKHALWTVSYQANITDPDIRIERKIRDQCESNLYTFIK